MKDLKNLIPLGILDQFNLRGKNVGFVIVDEIDGFCKVGGGNLAPVAPDAVIDKMIDKTDELALSFVNKAKPILILQDCHKPGVPEPPYPPHCEEGTGEEELVEKLRWLSARAKAGDRNVIILKKDCINGLIGGLGDNDRNVVSAWINTNKLEAIVAVGICTDICVLQFVQSALSARNHGMLPTLKDVVVVTEACATYGLPKEVAVAIGLPETLAHPRELTQYVGLYLMQMSGAILTKEVVL